MSPNEKINNDSDVTQINNNRDLQNTFHGENDQILNDVRNKTNLIKVLSQDLVIISVDKIRIAYTEHMALRSTRDAWVGPIGILVSMALTLLTSTFSETLGVAGATWKALFIFGALLAFVWVLKLAYKAAVTKSVDVESFIRKITVEEKKVG